MDNLRDLPVLILVPGHNVIPGEEIPMGVQDYEKRHEKTVSMLIFVPVDYELYSIRGEYEKWQDTALRPILGLPRYGSLDTVLLGEFHEFGEYYYVYVRT